ncbi:MAG TPA: hypothetical protein VFL63_06155 [Rhodanobacteraceae bacterium]|jgi:hypothetical protein|nr:hypothetical protein [Rhodanobacteraceae bacterium]
MAEGVMDEALEFDMCFRDGAVAAVGQVDLLRDLRAMASNGVHVQRAAARIIAHPNDVSTRTIRDSKHADAVL